MFDRKRSTTTRRQSFTQSLFSLTALVGCTVLGAQCGAPPACAGDACVSQGRFALSPPGQPGAHKTARFDLAVPLGGGGSLTVTIAGPSEDGRELSRVGAPFPLVVVSPGFLLGRGQYNDYLERLASHGFIAVSQSARAEGNHPQYRDDTSKLLSWLIAPTGGSATRLAGRVDSGRIGLAGHSLGGKISLLTAAQDSRVKAVITIDPVDGQGLPLAKDSIAAIHLPPGIPIGFLGETISKSGAQPCSPAAFNYEVLYSSTTAERFAIRFLKAAHTDFVDKPASCFPCLFCPGGTAPKAQTHELAVKYVTAYFLYTLAGDAAAASYLTGTEVQKDVTAGDVTVQKS